MKAIEVTEDQYAAHLAGESITIEPKVKQWVPSLKAVWISWHEKIWANSKEAAKDKWDAMDRYKTLLDYVEEFDGDWVADWDDVNQAKGYVCYNGVKRSWFAGSRYGNKVLAYVDMSQSCANGLADKLNSGEVRL